MIFFPFTQILQIVRLLSLQNSLIVLLQNSTLTGYNKCSRNAVNREVVMWPADCNNRTGMSVILADRRLSWSSLCVLKSG